MSAISRYLTRQIAAPLAFFVLTLSGVVWLTQSLRMLDVIITKGQTAFTFMTFSLLVFPTVLVLILPVAFFAAILYGLQRMQGDHELVVLSATGQSPWTIIRPVMWFSGAVTAIVLLLNLWITPAALNELRGRILEVRADFAASLLREGAFSTPMHGLTVYLRGRNSGGEMLGILVHDNRDLANPVTYMAERGALVKTALGPRLIMVNGNVQRQDAETGGLSLLYFDRYTYDLSEFLPGASDRWKEPEERYLHELFFPEGSAGDLAHVAELRVEGHRRLATPFYVPAFALIALAVMLTGQFTRRGYFWRLGVAVIVTVATRLAGLGLETIAMHNGAAVLAVYLWPLLVCAACLLYLSETGRSRLQHWLLRIQMQLPQLPSRSG